MGWKSCGPSTPRTLSQFNDLYQLNRTCSAMRRFAEPPPPPPKPPKPPLVVVNCPNRLDARLETGLPKFTLLKMLLKFSPTFRLYGFLTSPPPPKPPKPPPPAPRPPPPPPPRRPPPPGNPPRCPRWPPCASLCPPALAVLSGVLPKPKFLPTRRFTLK